MSTAAETPARTVLSLAELLSDHPKPEPCLIEPALLPSQGILFVGGEPKVGKSLLVANLALALAAGSDRLAFPFPRPAAFWAGSSSWLSLRLSGAWPPFLAHWVPRPVQTCWWVTAPTAS